MPEMIVKEFNTIEKIFEKETAENIDTVQIFRGIPGSTLLLASVAGVLAAVALGTLCMVWWKLRDSKAKLVNLQG